MKTVLAVLLCAAGAARGEVSNVAANGFAVKITARIHAPPAEVYAKIVHVGEWWDPKHTHSGDAHNLSIEDRAMGCFCEKLPNGGTVQHMQVVQTRPGKMLRMYGGLGPLQGLAAAGPMTFELTANENGTLLELSYLVSGYAPNGLVSWGPRVNEVLSHQIERLKSYVDTGSATSNAAEHPKTRSRDAR